ncbi:alkaline phosphatase family protein [Microbacterium sp. SSW1-59]|uniref:alkaline phosphatase family protein n=1 Tax=Microbacterium xanthum TaxID=3079794 RepID=UPI002AD351B8|nr:alkaline phosphatase family protein [Microbacterium sp. SSW1-59]MDZ8202369.1 alkaline phosphatase family protein [Microbacterium sp. SSW1-59]
MSLSLPAESPRARSLTGVLPECLAALTGNSAWFPAARSAIVFLLDGLGAGNLTARSGHARFLSVAMARRDVAQTVFPSTTAAALAALLTGERPGRTGMVGYRALQPSSGRVVNQLRGWEHDELPVDWQRAEPLFEREAAHGRPCFVVTKSEYTGSGFTRSTVRGAEIVGVDDLEERVEVAADLAVTNPGSIVYLYAPDLDAIGHRHGWESDEWSAMLERVDGCAARLARRAGPDTGVVVTADHGMVDVPRHRHILFGSGPLTDGLRDVGGEPRMLHLYAQEGAATSLAEAWRIAESARSWVMTRDEAVSAGLFGPVDPEIRPRIGDVLVAARQGVAYYDDRVADTSPQKMVGQHGSLTAEERTVPLIRLGAFAR